MKVTRERKIIGAVLVIGLGVLGYDQLSGAATGDGAQGETGSTLLLASASGSSNKSNASQLNAADGISLASRLSSLAASSGARAAKDMRDAFRPADGWFSKPVVADAPVPTISPADKFAADHRLMATSLNTAGEGVAVVDGTLLHVGTSIAGYRLIEVTRTSAVFESSDGSRAQLKLPPVSSAASAAAR